VGRTLELWAKNFGIHGLGIEIHSFLCRQAQKRIVNAGLHGQAEIIHANPSMYLFDPNMYDIASCLGASFVWGGFQQALQGMKKSFKTKGKIIVGEPYYIQENVPESLIKFDRLIQISRNEGFDVEFVVRASRDDRDRYVSSIWYSLLQWRDKNKNHPELHYVIDYLHKSQDTYFRYQITFEGWAIYIQNQIT